MDLNLGRVDSAAGSSFRPGALNIRKRATALGVDCLSCLVGESEGGCEETGNILGEDS